MRLKMSHLGFISRKIILDLLKSELVRLVYVQAECEQIVAKFLEGEIKKEAALDAKVEEILREQEDQIDLMQANSRELFKMSKSHLAAEFDVIMNYEERYEAFSLQILNALVQADAINYTVADLRVRNVIFKSIMDYFKIYEEVDEFVYEKIKNHKRKLIPGSEEYNLVYEQLYREELNKRGL